MTLSPTQVAQFEQDGYLLLRGALADADLDPVIAEYEAHISRRAREMMAAGTLSELYADQPFNRRLIAICRENDAIYDGLDIMHFRGRASFEFLANGTLLDIVESLVGPALAGSPVPGPRAELPAEADRGQQREGGKQSADGSHRWPREPSSPPPDRPTSRSLCCCTV